MSNKYLCFSQSTKIDLALARYKQRFGQEPKEQFTEFKLLWLGPVPGSDGDIGHSLAGNCCHQNNNLQLETQL